MSTNLAPVDGTKVHESPRSTWVSPSSRADWYVAMTKTNSDAPASGPQNPYKAPLRLYFRTWLFNDLWITAALTYLLTLEQAAPATAILTT